MAITKPTKKAVEFIDGAPDAVIAETKKPKGVKMGNKQQISLTISPDLLEKVDGFARELGQSRAAVINLAIYRAVEHGLLLK